MSQNSQDIWTGIKGINVQSNDTLYDMDTFMQYFELNCSININDGILKRIFNIIDSDNDGKISNNQLITYQRNVTNDDINVVLMDEYNDNKIRKNDHGRDVEFEIQKALPGGNVITQINFDDNRSNRLVRSSSVVNRMRDTMRYELPNDLYSGNLKHVLQTGYLIYWIIAILLSPVIVMTVNWGIVQIFDLRICNVDNNVILKQDEEIEFGSLNNFALFLQGLWLTGTRF